VLFLNHHGVVTGIAWSGPRVPGPSRLRRGVRVDAVKAGPRRSSQIAVLPGSPHSVPYLTAPRYASGFAVTFARHPWQQRNTLRLPRVTLMGDPIEPKDFPVTGQTR
jgi:hypothetical protein